MGHKVDKRDRSEKFRQRLAQAMQDMALNQSALARRVGIDRSTISQLLKSQTTRLPNAQIVAECASALGVSADWLLGLSDHSESTADVLAASMRMTKAPRSLVDEQIFDWHQEAEGYKIRHVPASLPDILKTPEMLAWEYTPQLGRSAEQAIGAARDRLDLMREFRSDYEIAMPAHELENFALAQGYYAGLSAEIRREQINRLMQLNDQLYPGLRIFLFDDRRVFSSPITVFGPLIAVLYLGHDYLAFRDHQRVAGFSRHFDWLVREATVSDRDMQSYLKMLLLKVQ